MHSPLFRAIGVLAADIPAAKLCALPFGQSSAKPPSPPPPVPMPDLLDPAILAEKNRVRNAAAARSGRASTLLSGGGDDYSGQKLGTL